MNAPTPTIRTDAATYPADCLGATLVTNRDLARALETELAALTAERDQLRAEVERLSALGSWAHTCIHHTDEKRKAWAACPCCAMARAERAEAELAAEREKSERYRLVTLRQDAELAAERARLDWLEKSDPDSLHWWTVGEPNSIRDDIDAAMKEGAK